MLLYQAAAGPLRAGVRPPDHLHLSPRGAGKGVPTCAPQPTAMQDIAVATERIHAYEKPLRDVRDYKEAHGRVRQQRFA